MPSTFSADDLFRLLQNLCPPGAAFPRDDTTVQSQLLKGLADTEYVTAGRASNLLVDAFPSTTVELLPEWEATLGLPSPCWGPEPTLQERQRSVLAKLLAQGGQSIPYLISICNILGFPNVFFQEYRAYEFGDTFGLPMLSEGFDYLLTMEGVSFSIHYFELGHDTCGEPFAWWDNSPIQCELKKLAPAHAYLQFQFGNVILANISEPGHATDTPSANAHFVTRALEKADAFESSRYNTAWQVSETEAANATDTPNGAATYHKSITEAASASSAQDWSTVQIHESTNAAATPSANATYHVAITNAAAATDTPGATATYHVGPPTQSANATSAQDAIDTAAGNFVVDSNGNIILDSNGNPILAPIQ